MLGRGLSLRIHGTNLAFIEQRIPRLSGLMSSDMEEVAERADACVIGMSNPELASVLTHRDDFKLVLDLHRGAHSKHLRSISSYRGASW